MDIQEILCREDVVQYIAYRHHMTAQEIIAWFLPTELNPQGTCLEGNEIEIIRDLIKQNKL